MEEKERMCVVKDKIYDFYRNLNGWCAPYASQAILKYSEVPEDIRDKKDSRWEIIFLDSKEGLELLAGEKSSFPNKKVLNSKSI
jgi:hypothetical protein